MIPFSLLVFPFSTWTSKNWRNWNFWLTFRKNYWYWQFDRDFCIKG